ncbi:hypothetical protein [Vibrio cyclitrophicus]|uniref:hypothetical protein n=1 Tax=Vibrio cyclitrophicus TaxID=47951 RepID=UPI000374F241|nr:hypothetical protein [Vibrio cyclitrophicus]OEF29267.1 hypothetical protein OA9_09930 [Vibrio cyclitrophicus 1F97]
MKGMMYPDYLPHPHFTASGIKQQSNRIRSEMTTGRTRQRRRFLVVPAEQTLEWRLPSEKAAAFLGWVEHALSGGIKWFRLNQRTELGVMPVDIRMIQHPLENAKKKGSRFVYSVKCEIRQYPIQSEEMTVNQILSPHTLDEFVTGIDMSTYYTESWKDAE